MVWQPNSFHLCSSGRRVTFVVSNTHTHTAKYTSLRCPTTNSHIRCVWTATNQRTKEARKSQNTRGFFGLTQHTHAGRRYGNQNTASEVFVPFQHQLHIRTLEPLVPAHHLHSIAIRRQRTSAKTGANARRSRSRTRASRFAVGDEIPVSSPSRD